MNQILYTAESKSRGPLPIKTITRFFAFSLITLGVIFLGENTFSLVNKLGSKPDVVVTSEPKIEFAKDR